MRILVLGAGAIGGYFGGRLVASGADVTFLVRPRRSDLLRNGLKIQSECALGNIDVPVNTLKKDDPASPFDAVILSNKAYDLDSALTDIAPYLGAETIIVPLLNGLAHISAIENRFPETPVLAGTVACAATLMEDGTILHLGPMHRMAFGLRQGQEELQPKAEVYHAIIAASGVDAVLDEDILGALWEKWIFLAALAAATCLMRATVGQVLATDHGTVFVEALLEECKQTAAAEGHPYNPAPGMDFAKFLLEPGSNMTASMLRDMRTGGQIEADHIIGDMIRRGVSHGIETPYLKTALTHLQIYQAQRG